MTLEAIAIEPELMGFRIVIHEPAIGQKLLMTPDAILMNHLLPCLLYVDHLGFQSECEH